MAKRRVKKETEEVNVKVLVDCSKCEYGGERTENHLIDCFNDERNPKGYKVGVWLKECKYYAER